MSFSIFSQEIEYNHAVFYLKNNQLVEATSTIQTAIRKVKSNKSKYYLLYADVLKFQNIADSSLYYFTKVENDYKRRKVADSLLYAYTIKTEFYRYFDEKKKAEDCILEIGKFNLQKIKNKDIVAYALNRKMAIFNGYHDGSKDTLSIVKQIAKQIISLEKQIKNKEIIAYTLNEVAQIEDYKGDKNLAFSKYLVALNYAKINKLLNPEIDITYNLAKLHATFKKDNNKAAELLERLVTKVEEGSNIRQKFSLFLQLKDYYREINQYQKALFASDKAYSYSQDLNNQEAYIKLNVLEKKYELEKKEKKIQEKEIEIKIKDLEIKNNSKKFWLAFIIFLITIIGIIMLTFFFRREKKSNRELRLLSSENEFLLSEANHRINNNLQLVIILISNQLKKLPEKKQFEIKKILSKVDSIATLHRHLYQSKDKSEVNCKKYLTDIKISFFELFKENKIQTNFNIQNIHLQTDIAMYLGLLLTELYINSIKHAFKEDDVKFINFELTKQNELISFNYNDNGTTLQGEEIKPILIDKLCRQLKIEYSISTSNGFSFTFIKQII